MSRLIFFLLILVAGSAAANEEEVVIIFEDPKAPYKPTESSWPGILDNPVLASGIASGTDALNRGVTTLLDSMFYRLMDNEFKYSINEQASVVGITQRDVIDTPDGKYVIVDTIGLGPRFVKELYHANDLQLNAELEGTTKLYHIYLRTDGMRLADKQQDSIPDKLIKNWFGILPGLTMLLPPAFNANELYDPMNILKIAFRLPTTKEKFYDMDTGSILSYAISGGIRLPLSFIERIPDGLQKEISKVENLTPKLPYAVFLRGEHRLNVMRRSRNIAWVGISRVNTLGHSLSLEASSAFYILENSLPYWKGVPLKLVPLGIDLGAALNYKFDLLYEFDLSHPAGEKAFLAAVKGDFSLARATAASQSPDEVASEPTNAIFHFNKNETETESGHSGVQNFLAMSYRISHSQATSEVNITDQQGRFYLLKARSTRHEEWSDLLVGKESISTTSEANIHVDRVYTDVDTFHYQLSAKTMPYYSEIHLQIQDRNTDSLEFRDYFDRLADFAQLDRSVLPQIPLRDQQFMDTMRKRQYLYPPSRDVKRVNYVPMVLGRFFASAKLYFDNEALQYIAKRPAVDKWEAFAEAYGLPRETWTESSTGFLDFFRWARYYAAAPLAMINLELAHVDAIKEATKAISALDLLNSEVDPEKLQGLFQKILNSKHPERNTAALLRLAQPGMVGRSIQISSNAKGNAPRQYKDIFNKLSEFSVQDGPRTAEISRERGPAEKLQKFQPQGMEAKQSSLEVTQVVLVNKIALATADRSIKNLQLNIYAKGLAEVKGAQVYLKLEQAGTLQIGRLHLFEGILPLEKKIDNISKLDHDSMFSIILQGDGSPVATYMSEYSLGSGGDFLLTLALSHNGKDWSESRQVKFRIEEGALVKAAK
jgi:hypothetical protein